MSAYALNQVGNFSATKGCKRGYKLLLKACRNSSNFSASLHIINIMFKIYPINRNVFQITNPTTILLQTIFPILLQTIFLCDTLYR
jgi:hypothetical protein